MAGKALKGLTIKIGGDTSELLDSLKDVEKKSKSLSGELGQINKLLKLDPKNTELLAQKQKVLAEAIDNTQDKLDSLHEAEKQAQKQLAKGDITEEQYRALQREIIATEKKLNGYKDAAMETASQVRNLGSYSATAAAGIDDTGDAAADAEDDVDGLDGSLEGAAGGFTAVATAAAGALAAIVATAEASREYRTAQGKLTTAFEQTEFSAKVAKDTYKELQSVLGDTDKAIEASSMLARLCEDEENLAEWSGTILPGVFATFGDSLPVEGLAEAANETAKVGQVTGPLADALNWAAAEGETFGVTLKENIDLEALEQEELNALTNAERAACERKRKHYEEIEAYNTKVKEAASAEDMFNIALENCSTEQERQQLITKTLTGMYGKAATQYKKTNNEVIRSNKATEKWNEALAGIGEEVEPLVTDVKEFGVSVLEWAAEPLKDIANWIRTKLIPAVKDIGDWISQNKAPILGFVSGLTAGFVAYKAITTTHTAAVWLQVAAQKALNTVMNMNPVGLMTGLLVGLTTALWAAGEAAKSGAAGPLHSLSEEEYKAAEEARKAAEEFENLKKSTEENINNINMDFSKLTLLKDELLDIVDAKGKVNDADKNRAEYILGQFNEVMGTEYELVGNSVKQWKELKENIDQVILSKQAEALLEAANDTYVQAKQNESAALETASNSYRDYLAEKDAAAVKIASVNESIQTANDNIAHAIEVGDAQALSYWQYQKSLYEEEIAGYEANVAEKKTLYEKDIMAYLGHRDTVTAYTEAQQAALSGNHQRTIELLTSEGDAYIQLSDDIDAATQRQLQILYKNAVDAGLAAEDTKKKFESGINGYTKEMVDEAYGAYDEAMQAFGDTYADAMLMSKGLTTDSLTEAGVAANGILGKFGLLPPGGLGLGKDLGAGIANGLESKRGALYAEAQSIVSGMLRVMDQTADRHSPAGETIDFAEDVGEGVVVGLKRKTKDVNKAAQRQAESMLSAYRSQEVNAQKSLRHIAEQQTLNRAVSQLTAANASAPMLEKILAAVEKGQVLLLDGDAVVGGTAGRMDSALGRRRALAAGGAI